MCFHMFLAEEIDQTARQCIRDNWQWVNSWGRAHKPEPCVFGDLLGLVASQELHSAGSFAERCAMADAAVLQGMQHCYTHGGLCSVLRPVHFDVSGLPCEDNSRANTKRKFQDGRFGGCYSAWCRHHREMQTPVLILENTPDIRAHVIHECLGQRYSCLQLFVDPEDAGHAGISRPRTYIIFYHQDHVVYRHDVFDLYAAISDKIKKMVRTRPSDYLVSSETGRWIDFQTRMRKRKKPVPEDHEGKLLRSLCFLEWTGTGFVAMILLSCPCCHNSLHHSMRHLDVACCRIARWMWAICSTSESSSWCRSWTRNTRGFTSARRCKIRSSCISLATDLSGPEHGPPSPTRSRVTERTPGSTCIVPACASTRGKTS